MSRASSKRGRMTPARCDAVALANGQVLGSAGTNLDDLDDLGDHRPGQTRGSRTRTGFPLADVGFSKRDVRAASRLLGLETAAKPAAACLAWRIAYGDSVTPELLARIEAAEEEVRALPAARSCGGRRRHVMYECTDGVYPSPSFR